jgi:hypothetical protein
LQYSITEQIDFVKATAHNRERQTDEEKRKIIAVPGQWK